MGPSLRRSRRLRRPPRLQSLLHSRHSHVWSRHALRTWWRMSTLMRPMPLQRMTTSLRTMKPGRMKTRLTLSALLRTTARYSMSTPGAMSCRAAWSLSTRVAWRTCFLVCWAFHCWQPERLNRMFARSLMFTPPKTLEISGWAFFCFCTLERCCLFSCVAEHPRGHKCLKALPPPKLVYRKMIR